MHVGGIGSRRYAALLTWRTRLESQAQHNAPSQLPRHDTVNIENRFINERQTLETEKQRLQTQLFSQVTAIRQKAATARQTLNQEEQQVRNQTAQEQSVSRHSYAVEIATLEKKAAAAKSQAAPTIAELSDKLRVAQKQIFALHWQSSKQEREGQRFGSLRFPDYLESVVGL